MKSFDRRVIRAGFGVLVAVVVGGGVAVPASAATPEAAPGRQVVDPYAPVSDAEIDAVLARAGMVITLGTGGTDAASPSDLFVYNAATAGGPLVITGPNTIWRPVADPHALHYNYFRLGVVTDYGGRGVPFQAPFWEDIYCVNSPFTDAQFLPADDGPGQVLFPSNYGRPPVTAEGRWACEVGANPLPSPAPTWTPPANVEGAQKGGFLWQVFEGDVGYESFHDAPFGWIFRSPAVTPDPDPTPAPNPDPTLDPVPSPQPTPGPPASASDPSLNTPGNVPEPGSLITDSAGHSTAGTRAPSGEAVLASTGASVFGSLVLGVSLLAVGAAAMWLRSLRRRRHGALRP